MTNRTEKNVEPTFEQQVAMAKYLLTTYKIKLVRRKNFKQEIVDGVRHEDGSLVNPGLVGRPALLTSEERVKNRRESQRRYKEKCRLKEIEAGIRDADGSLVQVDREKPGPKPKFKDPDARIAHEKALRLKRKQARIESEIEAGIRDADGKLIK